MQYIAAISLKSERRIMNIVRQCLVYLLCLSVLVVPSLSQNNGEPLYILVGERNGITMNRMSLSCISQETTLPRANAIFMLNGTNLNERAATAVINNGLKLVFVIRRHLEGSYTCGFFTNSVNIEESRPVQFVAFPEPSEQVQPRTFFAQVGTTATLNCLIPPGNLIQQYYVTWRNGTTGPVYREIPRPINSNIPTTPPPDTRYSIIKSTFSLQISNVQLSDSGNDYRCILGVEEVQGQRRAFIYTQTREVAIRLIVYKPPRITVEPVPATISLRSMPLHQFNCTAKGDPAPEISWRHNGQPTTRRLYDVTQSMPIPDPSGEGFLRTGSLRIYPLNEQSSGWVECVASITEDTTGGQVVSSDVAGARLSVIGGFKSFDILITQDGDVIYKLRLRGMINIPVHLNLEYIDASDDAGNNPARQSKITSISYNSTDTISHIEFKSQVPFQKFRVGVSMVNGFDEGPMNMTDTVFDTSSPTGLTLETVERFAKIAVIGIVPCILLFLLCLTAIVISCIYCCMKGKESEFTKMKKLIKEVTKIVQENDNPEVKALAFEVIHLAYPQTCNKTFELGRTRAAPITIEADKSTIKRERSKFFRVVKKVIEISDAEKETRKKRNEKDLTDFLLRSLESGLQDASIGKELRYKVEKLLQESDEAQD